MTYGGERYDITQNRVVDFCPESSFNIVSVQTKPTGWMEYRPGREAKETMGERSTTETVLSAPQAHPHSQLLSDFMDIAVDATSAGLGAPDTKEIRRAKDGQRTGLISAKGKGTIHVFGGTVVGTISVA